MTAPALSRMSRASCLAASLVLVLTALGCGDDDGPRTTLGQETYRANLVQLNGTGVSGTATFSIDRVADTFTATITASGVAPGALHPQHIHSSTTCPGPAADTNGDGFIDVIEGVPSYGPILIPLDTDLSAQAGGDFPVGSGAGTVSYSQTTSLSAMLADLNQPDPDPSDAVIKLDGAPLNLDGRHVVLHGIDTATALPGTVASLGTLPATITLPIACGDIVRID